ncbi:MAG: hypothetical protein A2431_03865 [Candidatus Zambryskibacteria bacterium RIFOXYC1_FULL_39_10]|uniref:Band 7 domain-containing protein n=1 Tax=Candidatus Zambryskibacteria bacterium RIFOXYC1_FULL_39_10 TaxID=1802779 RepID=A0A1G2V186_9BACT|nr:MAG: hypothetical protein A2431_03865 [Candidatus Zambryskibacteria bacterium RIFOXYC1_FULL_39_10]OHB16481.1 MAG: hypothetical protein A2605_01570 [Candidatus Zambryskibacteria bacterium RIFOXYD1_FULL_39_35]
MGTTPNLLTGQVTPKRPGQSPGKSLRTILKNQQWGQIFAAIVMYVIIIVIGTFISDEKGEKWWLVALAISICHIYLSAEDINERQLGAMFTLGQPAGDLESGPYFAFWPFCYIRKETKNVVQLEIGVLTPEEKKKAAGLENSASVFLLEDPFYLNWGDLQSADYKDILDESGKIVVKSVAEQKKEEGARFKNNPLAKPLVTATHLTIRFEIWSLTHLIQKAGSLLEANELIQKAAIAALISYAGKSFVARAIADMESVDAWLKTTIENFVADPGSERYKEEPSRSWGVNIRKTQITRMGTAKRISEAQADQGVEIYKAQAEKFKLTETAAGRAEATKLQADADLIRLKKEGKGTAEAAMLLLFARRKGITELAKIAKKPEGQLILQLEALERALAQGKAVIVPMELSKIVGALGSKLIP